MRRWRTVFHYGFGYTVCPYCGYETQWFDPYSVRFQSEWLNHQREYCPNCKKRVYAGERWLMNQPPCEEDDEKGEILYAAKT